MIPTLARKGETMLQAVNWRTAALVFVLAALAALMVWGEAGAERARRACLLAGGVYAAGDCYAGRVEVGR